MKYIHAGLEKCATIFSPRARRRMAAKTEFGWKALYCLAVIVELSADACNDLRMLLSQARAYIRGACRQRATVKVKS